tara:strand:+ start:7646 stop:9298 length:1653 start_codon:yes stop_codon:yes gene_type:complete
MGIKFKSPLQLSAHRSIAHSDTAKTLIVKVITKTAAHPEYDNGSTSGYTIDGVEGAYLELTPGNTYKFDQSDSSNASHPLRFYEEANKTTAYTTGVTTNGTAGSSGAYTQIIPTTSTPPILFYQCSSHSLMGSYVKFGTGTIGDTYSINVSADGSNVDLNLDAASGTDSTVQLTAGTDISLTRNDANQVTIASTASGETYDLNATADGSNVDLNLTSTSGNDTSVVQLTAGTNVTLARNSANEITISSALANPSDSITVEKNIHTGDGSDTTFDASSTIVNENNIQIYIDGVYQSKDTYSTSGATVTFSTAPATGASIEFMHYVAVSGVVEVNLFTGDGSDTTFDISTTIATENKTQIYIDGVYQSKDTYSTNGTTVTFSTAPGNGAKIEIVHLLAANDTVNSNEIVDSAVVTAKLADNSVTNVKMADNAIDHAELAARYTEVQTITTQSGTINLDASAYSNFRLTSDLNGATTLNIQNMKTGQVIDITVSGSQTITLSSDDSSETFNKVGSTDYDGAEDNHIQIICIDDNDSAAIYNYLIGTYTSDTTP